MNKVGSYAVNPIDFNEWFKSTEQVAPTKIKKQKTKKKIIYPQFIEYANQTEDVFWSKKFNLWASGKLPKNFTVTNNILYYTKSKIIIDFPLVADGGKECISFFKTYGGIFSKDDEQQQIQEESEATDTTTTDLTESTTSSLIERVWTKCDKKTQELMLKDYVNNLSQVMKLSTKEHNVLLQTVRLSVHSKNFNKSNICIEQDKITEIRGLKFDQQTRTFIVEMQPDRVNKKKSIIDDVDEDDVKIDYPKDMITQYRVKFDKYLERYDKKYERYGKCHVN